MKTPLIIFVVIGISVIAIADADGIATTNNATTSLREQLTPFMEALDNKIAATKPSAEMSDSEVVAQTVENASAHVAKVGLGAIAAVGDLANKLVGSAADAIRSGEKAGNSTRQSEDVLVVADSQEPSSMQDSGQPDSQCGEVSAQSADTGEKIIVFAILGFAIAAAFYGFAYARVKSGNMVVYSSWADFASAAAWVVLLLIGYGCEYAAADGGSMLTAARVFKWSGYASAVWMVGGAFRNHGIVDVVFAIPARIIVAVLVLFAWSKLKEAIDGCREGRKGVVDGVLIPLGIALFVFNALVKPMIGDNRT